MIQTCLFFFLTAYASHTLIDIVERLIRYPPPPLFRAVLQTTLSVLIMIWLLRVIP